MSNGFAELHQQWIARTQECVVARLQGQQAGHGMDHVLRVLNNARQIQAELGGCRTTVELAALLHDVGDAKFHEGVERSGEFSRVILEGLDVPAELIRSIVDIVDNISFRKGVPGSQLSLEGQIVQDADRLDALGAIGIVRTIEYGAVVGQPFYLPGQSVEDSPSGIGHFYQKLFKLTQLLNTDAARRLAAEREKFMWSFLEQFYSECGATAPETSI